jgi:hypothetical protein
VAATTLVVFMGRPTDVHGDDQRPGQRRGHERLGGRYADDSADTGSPPGSYPIVASGLVATNYAITFANGTLTVTPATLTVTADNQGRTYGAANPVLTGVIVGVQNGDHLTASYSTSASAGSAVGSYSIVPMLNDPDHQLGNYSVTVNEGTLTVTLATLIVTDDQARRYGAAIIIFDGQL